MISSNKVIAKNTMYLYLRLLITMVVSLYTARVVIQTLGITDYGIYGLVGSIVGFMGFINAALATSSSRFLTHALGEGDSKRMENTFVTTLTIHVLLGVLILIIAEAIGPWALEHKMNIPPERLSAAKWAFQFSVFTIAIGVSQVPYNAVIIAHERMNIYAYVSIADAVLRLLIAILIQYFGHDKLIFFTALVFAQSLGIMLFYRIYCGVKFVEAKFKFGIDKNVFKTIMNFSGLNLVSNMSNAFSNEGVTLLLGMFFNPAVLAARAIAIRVLTLTTQFIGNFRQAMYPQIIKLHAAKEYKEYTKLVLQSGLYSFFIMWIIVLPIILLADPLLRLWLGEIPEYTVIFVQLIMIECLFWLFDSSFNDGILATGEIKQSTLYSSILQFLRFGLIYILFKLGYSPVWSILVGMVVGFITGIVVKPYLLHKLMNFEIKSFFRIYLSSFKVVLISIIIPVISYFYFDTSSIVGFLIVGIASVSSTVITIYFVGIEKKHRVLLINMVKKKFSKQSK